LRDGYEICTSAWFKDQERQAIREHEGIDRMPLDVLIVDDSAAIRKILHRVLVQAELQLGKVVEANDGQEALNFLNAQSFGLILSDINMPNMDGIEMLGKIKANAAWNKVPIIMVTTEGSQEKVMQALQLGASGYVRKPFTLDQIKEKLLGLV
jgi:two-component system chemotaxis response regulator CheY